MVETAHGIRRPLPIRTNHHRLGYHRTVWKQSAMTFKYWLFIRDCLRDCRAHHILLRPAGIGKKVAYHEVGVEQPVLNASGYDYILQELLLLYLKKWRCRLSLRRRCSKSWSRSISR